MEKQKIIDYGYGAAMIFLVTLAMIGIFSIGFSHLYPNPSTVQALCPLNITQILNLCTTYNLPYNSISSSSITCYTVASNNALQVDGATPTGWIIDNYSMRNCQVSGWQNV